MILVGIASHTSSEWRFLPAAEPNAALRLVAAREPDHEYDVEHARRALLHPHQQGMSQLPGRDRADLRPRPRELEGALPVPRRRHGRGRRRLRGLGRVLRARGRPAAPARHERQDGRELSRRLPRGDLLRVSLQQPRVRRRRRSATSYESFTTPPSVYDYDMATKTAPSPEAERGPGRLRPDAVHLGAALRHGVRRHDACRSRSSTGRASSPTARRRCSSRPTAPTALRADAAFNSNRVEPPRPRHSSTPIGHIRGGGDLGQGLARPGPDDDEEEHLHRLHRGRRGAGRRQVHVEGPPRHRGRQRGRPADGRRDEHAARPLPRRRSRACPSSTSSTRCSTSRCR